MKKSETPLTWVLYAGLVVREQDSVDLFVAICTFEMLGAL